MNNIHVGNLDLTATERTIRGLFAPYGAIERVKIMTDRKTDQPTGIAFVEMTNDAEAEKAIVAANGTELKGRTLSVTAARPQLHRGARPKRGQDSHDAT